MDQTGTDAGTADASEFGYVKLYRKILDSDVFANEGLLKVFIWCLTKASYRRRHLSVSTGRGSTVVTIEPGQFVFGRNSAARELDMPPKTVESRMKRLEELRSITLKPAKHFSVVSIANWSTYQANDNTDCHPIARQLPGNCQAIATNKNVKNGRTSRKNSDGAICASSKEEEVAEFERIANRIAAVVPIHKDDNRWLVQKVAMLVVRGLVVQDDLEQSLESVRVKHPSNPAAWFRRCLSNKIKARGESLKALLKISETLGRSSQEHPPAAVPAVTLKLKSSESETRSAG